MNRITMSILVAVASLIVVSCAPLTAHSPASIATVIDIPVTPSVTQRILYTQAGNPVATIVALPGGRGWLGIRDDGSVEVPCFPIYRIRQALADQGIASALVDKASDGSVYGIANVAAVVHWVQRQSDVPVWLVGGSSSTNAVAAIANQLPVDARIGTVFFSPASPDPAIVPRLSRPALVVYNTQDAWHDAPAFHAALTASPSKAQIALTGRDISACGAHLFQGLDDELARAIGDFVRISRTIGGQGQ